MTVPKDQNVDAIESARDQNMAAKRSKQCHNHKIHILSNHLADAESSSTIT